MQFDMIIDSSVQSIRATTSALEAMSIAQSFYENGDIQQAIRFYAEWIKENPTDNLLYAIIFNYSVILSNSGYLTEAKAALEHAITLKPDFLPQMINLGLIQEQLGNRMAAVEAWLQVSRNLESVNGETISQKKSVLKQIGRVLEAAHYDSEAESILQQSLDIDPHQPDIIQHWLSLRQRQCKWPIIEPLRDLCRNKLVGEQSPLSLAAYTDDPLLQLANAATFYDRDVIKSQSNVSILNPQMMPYNKIRVGYLSSDLREHAIGYLMAELLEEHDQSRFEVYVYYCGPVADDPLHSRFKASPTRWADISKMSDEEAKELIKSDQITILVDVNGYTHSARSSLVALRPAGTIVNWLGFPGTMGSTCHDYIIADEFIIPPGNELFYSEKVIRLPCYQPNDRKRRVSNETLLRSDVGLPDDGIVYCCFNAAHKFTSFTWKRWMQILSHVPGSILWLMESVPSTMKRLQLLAKESGIDPGRIIFAPRMSNSDHLLRISLSDLFLDTSPYGAHTTASDTLWSGVPVLTISGRSFASRVCGSLVSAAGLPELVCRTAEEYVQTAIALGQAPNRIKQLSHRLRSSKLSCVLFDTSILVRRLEDLFYKIHTRFVDDNASWRSVICSGLLLDIGTDIDSDQIELSQCRDYMDLYYNKMRARGVFPRMGDSDRLWRPVRPSILQSDP